ncbi:unnamed protein product [Citrullus colocynthis]|uniref:Uncharacterized protein n=1 Tax=Citrullus colocynthis TaxID=252529 RepID=A0ABP0Z3U4_9ROSI
MYRVLGFRFIHLVMGWDSNFSIGTMGGGEHAHGEAHGDFRAKVWSMSGGPYCRPKHWKRNTAIAMAGIVLVCIPIAMKSAELEQRPHNPVRPIPSQLWCKNFGNKEY